MVDRVDILPGFELDNFPEVSIQFLNGCLCFNKILVVYFCDWESGVGVEEMLFLNVINGSAVYLSFHLPFDLSLQSVGRVSQYSIVFITSHKNGHSIFGLFKEGVFEVSVGFSEREVVGGIMLTQILEPQLIEVWHVVIHFA